MDMNLIFFYSSKFEIDVPTDTGLFIGIKTRREKNINNFLRTHFLTVEDVIILMEIIFRVDYYLVTIVINLLYLKNVLTKILCNYFTVKLLVLVFFFCFFLANLFNLLELVV